MFCVHVSLESLALHFYLFPLKSPPRRIPVSCHHHNTARPFPHPSSHRTLQTFPVSPLFRNIPYVSGSFINTGNTGNTGINGINGNNGSNGCHLPSPIAAPHERSNDPLSNAQSSSNYTTAQNLDRIVILATDRDYNRLNDQFSFECVTSLSKLNFSTCPRPRHVYKPS
jgi:hypothetical protein